MYFLTICVKDRKPVLANSEAFAALQEVVGRLEGKWIFRAATLMPDHLHLLVIPFEREASIGNLSAAIKRWLRQILKAEWQWQEGCFDHLIRSGRLADAKWEYMRENPVRAGLVRHWNEWPYHYGIDPDTLKDLPFSIEM